MKRPPSYEPRRRAEFESELRARARAWLPEWQGSAVQGDLAGALFSIAARLSSEVAQRLDRMPEKNFRGLLHWLGQRGKPGRAARVPVVFRMSAGAEPVTANPPVQVQATAGEQQVMFETTSLVEITASALSAVIAADPSKDAYYEPPADILSMEPPKNLPSQWRLLSDGIKGSSSLQLDPLEGLESGVLIRATKPTAAQYRIVGVKDGLVNVAPRVGTPQSSDDAVAAAQGVVIPEGEIVKRVSEFEPFASDTRDVQEHAVYVGSTTALDIKSSARIELRGWEKLSDFDWAYSSGSEWKPIFRDREAKGLVLLKGAGAIDEVEVSGHRSRWLCARRQSLGKESEEQVLSPVRLLVNCDETTDASSSDVVLEGIANTTPLVLNADFHPLGREPRLFDAFYLGSKEAFSKPNARATVHFELGDEWSSAPAALTMAQGKHLVFAIGKDAALRVVQVTDDAANPGVEFLMSTQPPDGSGHFINLARRVRPGVCVQNSQASVSASDGKRVWLWTANWKDNKLVDPGWISLGDPLGEPASDKAPPGDVGIETIITRNDTDSGRWVYAIVQGRLYRRDATGATPWRDLDIAVDGLSVKLAKIVPCAALPGDAGAFRDSDGLLGIGEDGALYRRKGTTWTDVTPSQVRIDSAWYPQSVVLASGEQRCIAVQRKAIGEIGPRLVVFDPDKPQKRKVSEPIELVGDAVEAVLRSGRAVAVFSVRKTATTHLAHWDAGAGDDEPVVLTDMPAGGGDLTQASVRIGSWEVLPTRHGAMRLFRFDPSRHARSKTALLSVAAIVDVAGFDPHKALRVDLTPSEPTIKKIVAVAHAVPLDNGRVALILHGGEATSEAPVRVAVYEDKDRPLRDGRRLDKGVLELADGDTDVGVKDRLYAEWESAGANPVTNTRIVVVDQIEDVGGRRHAILKHPLPQSVTDVAYVRVRHVGATSAALRPAVEVMKALATTQTVLMFPRLTPIRQVVAGVPATPSAGAKQWVVLAEAWVREPPAGETTLMVADASVTAAPIEAQPQRAQNPDLSWEYWDGSGWWQIKDLEDETRDLIASGKVEFCVPANIAATDVAGRNNFWVRARLVGGDYGQESVKIHTLGAPGDQTQTVTRSTENIRAPHAIRIWVNYRVCCPVTPDHVLTRDSGGTVDESAANRASDTHIQAFIPLAKTIGNSERALYLGFDRAPQTSSLSFLALVDEQQHEQASPLRVEVLRTGGFEEVASEDETRGLGESGTIKLSLETPPVQAQLFGRSLYWLRLLPKTGADPLSWKPVIRSLYANATWAEARETQANQMLGSSDGRPGLQLQLARTPVIADSLRLRVRERLSPEDVLALNEPEPGKVVDAVGDRPGPWVLWREVPDLLALAPTERVYTLDDETGVIRFGDGLHGMIPPIGRDSIIAEHFLVGGGEQANAVHRFGNASLVTPLPGVERVLFAADAAGGADADDEQRALRFAPAVLSQRERVATLADLESAALMFSRDVAQAVARRRMREIDLRVVMSGPDPLPSARVRRELARYLRQQVAPDLAADGAIVVRPPALLRAFACLQVRIAGIDHTSAVKAECGRRIRQLLDPRTGGFDGLGWPLGTAPTEVDLAASLDGVEHLDELLSARLSLDIEAIQELRPQPWQLVQMAPDGVKVRL